MRYLVGLVLALALLASPLSVSAQDAEEGATSEPGAQEPAPSSEPAGEERVPGIERRHPEAFVDPLQPASEPALKLEVDSTALEVTPTAPPTLEEMNVRVRRAGIGVGVSALAFVAGWGFVAAGQVGDCFRFCFLGECTSPPPRCGIFTGTGVVLLTGGLVGIIASGVILRGSKRDRDSLKEPRSLEPMSPDDLTGAKLRQRQRELRNLREAHYGTPRRVQWDLARSRFVF